MTPDEIIEEYSALFLHNNGNPVLKAELRQDGYYYFTAKIDTKKQDWRWTERQAKSAIRSHRRHAALSKARGES